MLSLRFLLPLALIATLAACPGLIDNPHEVPSPPDASPADGAIALPPPTAPDAATPDAAEARGIVWTRDLGAPDVVFHAVSDGAGGVIVAGSAGGVVRFDAQGVEAWRRSMTEVWSLSRTIVGGIALDARGGVVVAGDGLSALDVADGHTRWSTTFGGPLDTRGAAVLRDGTVVHVGFFEGTATFGSVVLTGTPGWNGFLVRYDPDGNEIAASVLGDAVPKAWGAFQADTDPEGDLVLVLSHDDQTTTVDTFGPSLGAPMHSVPLPVGTTPATPVDSAGNVFLVQGDAVTHLVGIEAVGADGSPLWMFHPPSLSMGGSVAADGPSRSIVWADSLFAIDAAGTATDLTPDGTLDAAASAVFGQTGFLVDGTIPPALVVDARHDVFVCGTIVANRNGGGVIRPFVAKVHPAL